MKKGENVFFRFTKDLAKYASVGLWGLILNLVLLYLFTEFAGFHYLVSGVVAAIIVTVNNFSINKVWTFKERLLEKYFDKLLKYSFFSLIYILLNIFLLYVLTDLFGIYYLISQTIVGIFLGVFSFLVNKKFTFGELL